MSQSSNVNMSLSNFCSVKLAPQKIGGMKFNIVRYCQAQSQLNTLTNKKINNINTLFNTSFNDTSVPKAMRYAQLVRNGGGTVGSLSSSQNTLGIQG